MEDEERRRQGRRRQGKARVRQGNYQRSFPKTDQFGIDKTWFPGDPQRDLGHTLTTAADTHTNQCGEDARRMRGDGEKVNVWWGDKGGREKKRERGEKGKTRREDSKVDSDERRKQRITKIEENQKTS